MWVFSYIKFRKKMNYFKVVLQCLLERVNRDPSNYQLQLRLASALTQLQQYKDAYEIYNNLLARGNFIPDTDTIKINMEFCKNPTLGASLKNYNGSWLHNFLLKRLGKRRCSFLTEEDYLLANSKMRNK